MIIVMRKDLNMRKGKMVAQGSHAAVGLALWLEHKNDSDAYKEWLESSFKKICVSVDSEEELLEIIQKALDKGLPAKLITDAGHTEFKGVPTKTCGAILGYSDELQPITGELKLL
jgi:PTH2 family peptidyl-tRNA hydrolase